ncbi:MAG TPA: hypothetical protein VFE27_07240 [Acidobacteriaceae bacterium]|jgi:hypothetical protein|nr:hypothetical protein [Acidobacteriaceae bacterium]
MNRRSLLKLGGLFAVTLPALAFQEEKSKLKITGVRVVRTRPRHPVPSYTPAPGSWSTGGVEVAMPRNRRDANGRKSGELGRMPTNRQHVERGVRGLK